MPQGFSFLVMFLTAYVNYVERFSLAISNELFPPGESEKKRFDRPFFCFKARNRGGKSGTFPLPEAGNQA